MNRLEHLAWAKNRALEYSAKGDFTNCVASFLSDMRKHEELINHPALDMMMATFFSGGLKEKKELEKFINDFN